MDNKEFNMLDDKDKIRMLKNIVGDLETVLKELKRLFNKHCHDKNGKPVIQVEDL